MQLLPCCFNRNKMIVLVNVVKEKGRFGKRHWKPCRYSPQQGLTQSPGPYQQGSVQWHLRWFVWVKWSGLACFILNLWRQFMFLMRAAKQCLGNPSQFILWLWGVLHYTLPFNSRGWSKLLGVMCFPDLRSIFHISIGNRTFEMGLPSSVWRRCLW